MRFFVCIFLILLVTTSSACSSLTEKEEDIEKVEGVIVEKDEEENQILVVPDMTEDEIKDKTSEEVIAMAQDREGAYYSISSNSYDNVETGDQVVVYWDRNEGQEDSDPPKRGAEMVEKVTIN
ncbi:hypothetical protein GCM10010954_21410 [Halobacillus andaensis]|uniref:DUF3221 domain-containing protein n=1 Tax=Halobacillus andaensis TaxID=1176239 RepID=A0A917B512_HALAA|nr:DUF3221 domain-containing protein [Halobacillus andaensis]MBP2004352.1 ABC-type Fe3+-hydroxamate transport system substrate-binding protein [Halobacillus andaensis]GGF22292.1 hypothetical protein GCM10010954_21410 [Halobacillus andaensis]